MFSLVTTPINRDYYTTYVKKGVIVFTKEDQEGDVLPVLDLKQTVDRKTKKIECSVYY